MPDISEDTSGQLPVAIQRVGQTSAIAGSDHLLWPAVDLSHHQGIVSGRTDLNVGDTVFTLLKI